MDDKSLESGWVARWIALLVLLLIPHFAFAACADEAKSIKEAVDEWAGDSALLKAQYDKASALLQKDDKCALAMAQLSRIVRKAGYLKGDQFRPESLAKSKTLALQAVQLDADCYLCQWELAHVYLYLSDAPEFNATLIQVRNAEKTPLHRVYTQALEANFYRFVNKDYAKAAQLAEAIQGD